ncbi:DNA-binding protein [Pseudomonas kilonensis]|uniref:helix-turn-helix domain-containing transcriptional regulator n=1 Tax=Pseudomonas kilonensis TaxID=132476 RepID=UPI00339A04F9
MIETFTEFDPAEYLSTPEAIAEFMRDARETDDESYIAKAMEVFARAKRMTELSRG